MPEHINIKDLSPEERPYEKCEKYGPQSLSEVELLAAIIKTGYKGENSIELARRVLDMTNSGNVSGISRMSVEELKTIKGIGMSKAVQIVCIAELSRRIAMREAFSRLKFNNSKTVADYYMEDLRHREQECVVLVLLDTKCGLIKDKIMTLGTVNQSLVSPREIFIEALKNQAVSIILLHNHPSGDPSPSREDLISTDKIAQAGKLIGISLIDHIIIGDNNYISLKERGVID